MTQTFPAMDIDVHTAYVVEGQRAPDTYLDRLVDMRYDGQVNSIRILLPSGEISPSSTRELRHRIECQYTLRLQDDVGVVERTQLSTITGGNVAAAVKEIHAGGG